MTCGDAFKNLNIVVDGDQVKISPCCLVRPVPVNIIDFQNDTSLNSVRNSWKSEAPPVECTRCTDEEHRGKSSRRHGSNSWYADHGYTNDNVELIRLDYWTGDTCNLRCVICGPQNSSAWKQELQHTIPVTKRNSNREWEKLDLSTLRYVHFNGGEPLLNKDHLRFLDSIPSKQMVHLNYNTNGTVLPSTELLDLWEQFGIVQLDFSIDDIGSRFEYQRHPAKWSEVTSNLQWFIDHCPVNCMFGVNTSVGVLNHANIHNLNEWLKNNFHSNRLSDPIEHRTQPVYGLFSLDNYKNRMPKIIEFLDNCDKRRGTDWKTRFPELIVPV